MPSLFIVLLIWHILSRILVSVFFSFTEHPLNPSEDVQFIGFLILFIGGALFILNLLFFAPDTIRSLPDSEKVQRCIAAIIYSAVSATHDFLGGIVLLRGSAYVETNIFGPVRDFYPSFAGFLSALFTFLLIFSMVLIFYIPIKQHMGLVERKTEVRSHTSS